MYELITLWKVFPKQIQTNLSIKYSVGRNKLI